MTLADVHRRSFYYFRNKSQDFRNQWEQVRQLVSVQAAAHGVKGSAYEIMPFDWDKKPKMKKAKPMTKQDVDNIFKRYNLQRNLTAN